jgi:hypothetical protein
VRSTSGASSVLLDHVINGKELICSEPVSISQVQGLDKRYTVEAKDIRDVLTGKNAPKSGASSSLDPLGICIRGARIHGELNLDGITATTSLHLTGCLLEERLMLRDAIMHLLVLERCVLPEAWADRAKVDTLTIQDCAVAADNAEGAIRLVSTHVTIDLRLTGTCVGNPAGPAVLATSLTVDASMFMDRLCTSEASDGAVCLTGATIADNLVLHGARLTASTGPAFNGEDMTVKGAAFLDQGFKATGAGDKGAVRLANASITGQLSLRGATLENKSGPALFADLLTAKSNLLADRGFTANADGAGELAAVQLKEAKISGDLMLDGATLANCSGPALAADLLTVQGDMTMTGHGGPCGRFSATGAAGLSTIQLRGATISGRLSLDGATVTSNAPAGRPRAGDIADGGAVCLSGATISGDLVLTNATLTSQTGPALMAELLTVKGDAACCDGGGVFHATGAGDPGAVCLVGANIAGQLSLRAADLTSANGPALVADAATVQGDVLLDAGFTATGAGPLGAVRLRGATMNSRLILDHATVTGNRPAGVPAADTSDYKGAVYLSGATVGHDFLLRNATLTASAGPALRADYLTVKGDTFRCDHSSDGFRATGAGDDGTVSLAAATLNGQVALRGTTLSNENGPALMADSVTILGDLFLDEEFTATGGSKEPTDGSTEGLATVRLVEASIGRVLFCFGRAVSTKQIAPALDLRFAKVGRLRLALGFASGTGGSVKPLKFDGLTYTTLPKLYAGNPRADRAGASEVSDAERAREWISLFQHSAPYSAQAYQQLATAYQGQGDDDVARRLLIAQRDDARNRGGLTSFNKALQWFLKLLVSYGYRSIHALFWLAGLFVLTAILAVLWFGPAKLIQPVPAAGTTPPKLAQSCSFTGQLGYAIDVAFPLITVSNSSVQQCDVATPKPNDAVLIFGWVVRVLSTTLLAIYAAGLTGLTSRSPGS